MGPDFILKDGDRLPVLSTQLLYSNGLPISLVGASEIRFRMRRVDALTNQIDTILNITVDDATNGKVTYSWQAGDTDTAGDYLCEFQVKDSTGRPVTVPNETYIHVAIVAGL